MQLFRVVGMGLHIHAGLAVEFWLPSCGTWSNVVPSTLLLKFFQGLGLGVGYGGQGTLQRRFEGPHTIFVTLRLSWRSHHRYLQWDIAELVSTLRWFYWRGCTNRPVPEGRRLGKLAACNLAHTSSNSVPLCRRSSNSWGFRVFAATIIPKQSK